MTFQPHVARIGSGARKVLALHCTLAHSGAWKSLARAMEGDGVAVTAMDMPSHGRSPMWDETGDFHDLVTDAAAGLLREPMDVVGHSFGASVALRLAIVHPDMVRSLTLIEPVIFSVALRDDPGAVDAYDAVAVDYAAAMEARNYPLAARLFNRAWGDGTKWDDVPERSRRAMTRGIHIVPACGPALIDDSKGFLRPGVLAGLPMPVMLLRGSETMRVIGVVNDGLARRIPGARNRVVPGAGHMVPITHPDATAAELRAHFATAPADAPDPAETR
ncbi:MAG: alpha/beta hydrolase [Rhodobacteraceae bacterium]|nr:alpha/beta hydrolase [Paracoccaceae bacterium]